MGGKTSIAIAGASGFVGRAFCDAFRDRYHLIGLSRGATTAEPTRGPHRWRQCDLFSLLQVERALAGAEVAVYLVHSMMPTDRLTQANFADLDLILADNFGRAAAKQGVKRIVYLGGLIPRTNKRLSQHLASRLEVEAALGAHGVPVTTLRAGLIVGAQGSSIRIVTKLVERLPAMLCPRWTSTPTQPVALTDVVELLEAAVRRDDFAGQTCDIGGPDVLTYRQMIRDVAELSQRRRYLLPAPLFSPRLSRLWVSLVTGTSPALVGPLVESLRHPMLAGDRRLQQAEGRPGIRWRAALRAALNDRRHTRPPAGVSRPSPRPSTVRSVQRLTRPPGATARDVAQAYLSWLPRFLWWALAVRADDAGIAIHLRGLRRPLLRLKLDRDRSTADRTLLYVTGGLLAKANAGRGRLEFRMAPDGHHIIAAVHDFAPRLPWFIYVLTQARAHLVVMWAFNRYLRSVDGLDAGASSGHATECRGSGPKDSPHSASVTMFQRA